jgi:hypothetical protein
MTRWRTLVTLVFLTLAGSAGAQTCSLVEGQLPDSHYRIQLTMELTGELKVQQDNKVVSLKTTASATHDYVERLLEAAADGTASRSARVYKDARVAIQVDQDKLQRSLRPERSFMVAQHDRDQQLAYCPRGPLTREELDVTEHFDTLAVTGLLPGKDMKVGDTWKVNNATVQALCHLQGLAEHTLAGKLEQVKDDIAVFSIAGTAAGIDQGAAVKATVSATGRFDLKQRRLVDVRWNEADEREQGPVSPASSMKVETTLRRTPIDPPNELSDVALVTWPVPKNGVLPQEMTDLHFKDPRGRFELRYARDWQVVGQTPEHLVLRLMDRGEFVAQVSIAPWKKAEPGKHMSEADFKETVAMSPGWEQDKLLKQPEVVALHNGIWAYLVAAEGDLDGVRAVQYWYLLAGPGGDQAVLTFTMTSAQAQKLGSRDLELVRGFTLPGAEVKGN